MIPKGKFGVKVLTCEYDPVYHECCPNSPMKGCSIGEGNYGIVNYEKMPMFIGSIYPDGSNAFMEWWGNGNNSQLGITGDRVTHWMEMPEPPSDIHYAYKWDMSDPRDFADGFPIFLQELFK